MLLQERGCTHAHGAAQTMADELQGISGASVKVAMAHQKGRCGFDVREDSPDEINEVPCENVHIQILLLRVGESLRSPCDG